MSFANKPSKQEFVFSILEAARDSHPELSCSYDEDDFSIRVEGGVIVYLGNLYDEYTATDPENREELVSRIAEFLAFDETAAIPDNYADARSLLLPRVRERAYQHFHDLRCRIQSTPNAGYDVLPLGTRYSVELVLDFEDRILGVSRENLAPWGVSFEDALADARANLLEMSGEEFECPVPGVFESPWRDNHDASRVYLTEIVAKLPVRGAPVAAIPNRDTLVITGEYDADGLQYMAARIDAAMEEPRFMGGTPLVMRNGRWQDYEPTADSPHAEEFRRLRLETLARDCEEQKELLDQLHEHTGEDVFVASLTLYETDEGGFGTYAVWSDGVESLIPEAEDLVFFRSSGEDEPEEDSPATPEPEGDELREDEEIIHCAWSDAAAIVTDLMTPMGWCPERYLVTRFPSEEQLESLRRVARAT